MEDLHQATTFNDVLRAEGGQPSQVHPATSSSPEDNQIDSTAINKNKGGAYEAEDDEDDEEMPESISDMIKKTDKLDLD